MAEAFVILVNIVQDYCFGPYACKRHVIYVLAIYRSEQHLHSNEVSQLLLCFGPDYSPSVMLSYCWDPYLIIIMVPAEIMACVLFEEVYKLAKPTHQ